MAGKATTQTGQRTGAIALVVIAVLIGGCGDGEFGKEFREVTASSFENGLTVITDGLIEGVFAVYEPDATTTDGTTSN